MHPVCNEAGGGDEANSLTTKLIAPDGPIPPRCRPLCLARHLAIMDQQTTLARDADPTQMAETSGPPDLRQLALVGIKRICELNDFSDSYFLDLVAKQLAPQPLRFGPRCTRWKAVDIAAFMREREERARADAANDELMRSRAKTASDAAARKRRAAAAVHPEKATVAKADDQRAAPIGWTATNQ